MNENFDIAGARELTNEELMLIQGGSAWGWVKKAATSAWDAITSPKTQSGLKTIGSIITILTASIVLIGGGGGQQQSQQQIT